MSDGSAYPPPGYKGGQQYPPQQPYGQQPYPPPPGWYAPPYGYAPQFGPPIEKPVGWFIVNWLFFWPTAIYSLVAHWQHIDTDAYRGDRAGAQRHADSVRRCGIWALVIGCAWTLFVILTFAVFVSSPATCTSFGGGC